MANHRAYLTPGDTVAALDIGTGKICCLIARIDGRDAQPRVIGVGHQVSHGVRAGAVSDVEAAREAILSAVQTAERMAGEQIQSVLVNLSGGQIRSQTVGVEVSISGHSVRDVDLQRVVDHVLAAEEKSGTEVIGRSGSLPARLGVFRGGQVSIDGPEPAANGSANGAATNGSHAPTNGIRLSNGPSFAAGSSVKSRRLMHIIPTTFSIDGDPAVHDPRGMYGDSMMVQLNLVTANAGAVRTLQTTIEQCHLEVDQFVASPYAAGLASLVEDELDLGATVIDMGAGTTTIGVFYDDHLIFASSIPVGGDHVTNDIARGMSTPVAHAERFKTLYGTVIGGAGDDQDTIEIPQVGEEGHHATNVVPKSVLNGILRPRLEETFELVRARLAESGVEHFAGKRAVLTGGASQLQGAAELAGRILDKQVRIGRPMRLRALAASASGPAFATCAGLIAAATRAPDGHYVPHGHQLGEKSGLTGRFTQWVREHL